MNSQRGIALVTILLIVALGTVMAASMVVEQQASIQATRGFLDRGQALQYALGGEELARQVLYEDFEEDEDTDHLLEPWASDELHYEFEDGEVNLQITDLQSLFNLNLLSQSNPGQVRSRQRLLNLVNAKGLDPAIVDRIKDWIDEDTGAELAGAEDFDYLVFDPPYRTGNALMADPSEIALLGMEPEWFQYLLPYLTALPDERSSLNINTASPGILQSLAPGLSFEAAETLVQRRDEEEGYETVQLFLQAPELAGLNIQADGLGVQSVFFEVRVIARYQDRFSYLTSILHRNSLDGSMRILHRDFSKTFRVRPAPATEEESG
ncbi:MAG: type II secretion system minor pseudopilin GspK [Pseudomonadales bacterium]|jgi:general secretion pathway protein K|nr:type II secretion system minor pseudopilin GspK [Pseudomonadales bacterium]